MNGAAPPSRTVLPNLGCAYAVPCAHPAAHAAVLHTYMIFLSEPTSPRSLSL